MPGWVVICVGTTTFAVGVGTREAGERWQRRLRGLGAAATVMEVVAVDDMPGWALVQAGGH